MPPVLEDSNESKDCSVQSANDASKAQSPINDVIHVLPQPRKRAALSADDAQWTDHGSPPPRATRKNSSPKSSDDKSKSSTRAMSTSNVAGSSRAQRPLRGLLSDARVPAPPRGPDAVQHRSKDAAKDRMAIRNSPSKPMKKRVKTLNSADKIERRVASSSPLLLYPRLEVPIDPKRSTSLYKDAIVDSRTASPGCESEEDYPHCHRSNVFSSGEMANPSSNPAAKRPSSLAPRNRTKLQESKSKGLHPDGRRQSRAGHRPSSRLSETPSVGSTRSSAKSATTAERRPRTIPQYTPVSPVAKLSRSASSKQSSRAVSQQVVEEAASCSASEGSPELGTAPSRFQRRRRRQIRDSSSLPDTEPMSRSVSSQSAQHQQTNDSQRNQAVTGNHQRAASTPMHAAATQPAWFKDLRADSEPFNIHAIEGFGDPTVKQGSGVATERQTLDTVEPSTSEALAIAGATISTIKEQQSKLQELHRSLGASPWVSNQKPSRGSDHLRNAASGQRVTTHPDTPAVSSAANLDQMHDKQLYEFDTLRTSTRSEAPLSKSKQHEPGQLSAAQLDETSNFQPNNLVCPEFKHVEDTQADTEVSPQSKPHGETQPCIASSLQSTHSAPIAIATSSNWQPGSPSEASPIATSMTHTAKPGATEAPPPGTSQPHEPAEAEDVSSNAPIPHSPKTSEADHSSTMSSGTRTASRQATRTEPSNAKPCNTSMPPLQSAPTTLSFPECVQPYADRITAAMERMDALWTERRKLEREEKEVVQKLEALSRERDLAQRLERLRTLFEIVEGATPGEDAMVVEKANSQDAAQGASERATAADKANHGGHGKKRKSR